MAGAASGHVDAGGPSPPGPGRPASPVAHSVPSSARTSIASVGPAGVDVGSPPVTTTVRPSYTGLRNRARIVPPASQSSPHAAAAGRVM